MLYFREEDRTWLLF